MKQPKIKPPNSHKTKPISPIIKIGLTDLEKSDHKKWQASLFKNTGETLDEHGNVVSKRNEDLFIGGPDWIDGTTCAHAPNGPRAFNDPKGNWADYYIKDKVKFETHGPYIKGYHLYSTARSIMGNEHYIEKSHLPQTGFNLRGPNMRKCYYHCGFLSEELLLHEGIYPGEFTGIYTVS